MKRSVILPFQKISFCVIVVVVDVVAAVVDVVDLFIDVVVYDHKCF